MTNEIISSQLKLDQLSYLIFLKNYVAKYGEVKRVAEIPTSKYNYMMCCHLLMRAFFLMRVYVHVCKNRDMMGEP